MAKKPKNVQNKDEGFDIDVFASTKIRVENVMAMVSGDAGGNDLEVKKFGNGAMIPFMKRYLGKKVVVFVIAD